MARGYRASIMIQLFTPYAVEAPKVENPIASILKSNVEGIRTSIVLSPVSNFMGFTLDFLQGHSVYYLDAWNGERVLEVPPP